MSIIGTRPPLISETNFYELHHRARADFSEKLRLHYYLGVVLEDENEVQKCFGTIQSEVLEATVRSLSYNETAHMDYSIHDAIEAGFNHVVFIIRKDIEKEFKEVIGDRIASICYSHNVTVSLCDFSYSVPHIAEPSAVDESFIRCHGWLGHLGDSERRTEADNRMH